MAVGSLLVPAFLRLISGRVFTREIMMSKHGGDKKRQSQTTPPSREGDKARPRDSGGSGQRTGAVPYSPASHASPTSWTVPTHEQIAVRAHENWEARGRPAGTDREDWFEADRQLQEEIKHPSLENVPEKESNMTEIGKHKLSDAIPHRQPEAGDNKGGRPVPTHETAAEQTCEAKESEEARTPGRRIGSGWWTSGVTTSRPGGKANEIHRARLARGRRRRGGKVCR